MKISFTLILFIFLGSASAQKYLKYNSEGVTLFKAGRMEEAAASFEKSIELFRKENAQYTKNYVIALHNLADAYENLGQYDKLEDLYFEAAKIGKVVYGKESEEFATCLVKLGLYYYRVNKLEPAAQMYRAALVIRKKTLGEEDGLYAECLSNLALVYQEEGAFEKAERLQLMDLQITGKAYGKNVNQYATSLDNLGVTYYHLDKFAQAEACYNEGLRIYKEHLGEVQYGNANLLNNLATLYDNLGQYEKAEVMYEKGLEIMKTLYGAEHPRCTNFLNNLATMYERDHRNEKADEYYQLALKISARAFGTDNIQYATPLNNYALFLERQGKSEAGEKLSLQVLEILKASVGTDHPSYATTLSNIGVSYSQRQAYDKAEPLLIEARDIIDRAYGKNHQLYTLFSNNLAEAYYQQHKLEKAGPLIEAGMNNFMKRISLLLPTLSEKEKQELVGSMKQSSEGYIDFAIAYYREQPSFSGKLYDYIIGTKGVIFESGQKMRSNIINSKDSSLLSLYDDWKRQNDRLVKVWRMSEAARQRDSIDAKSEEEKAYQLEKEISKRAYALELGSTLEKITWQDVQKTLKPGEAVIEIIRCEGYQSPVQNKIDTLYTALLITPQTHDYPTMITIENGGVLETKGIKYYRNCIKFETDDLLSYKRFWGKIAGQLTKNGIKKVFVSADGVYHQMNLVTLMNPTTRKFIKDEIDVQLISNSKDLVTFAKNPGHISKNFADYQLYLFGYPDFAGTNKNSEHTETPVTTGNPLDSTQRFLKANGKVDILPGTKEEVEQIKRFADKKQIKAFIYTESEATEGALKKLRRPDVLHIATHGFFLKNTEQGKSRDQRAIGLDSYRNSVNPLLRSGLLFANCEGTISGNVSIAEMTATNGVFEDGILTAQEAISLDLVGSDLVVLSACETGLGEINNGEGVYGLQRSLQQAGGKTIMMSLWNVNDAATQEMMTTFYNYLLAGTPKREAFTMAQAALRKKYPRPVYWGAFVMVGE